MRISDWSSDVCSSDLLAFLAAAYGYHLGFYYTFSVDYAVEEFGLSLGSAKMFWMVVGMFGLPAIFTGVVLRTLGLRRLLILSFIGYSASGLVILASSPNLITIYGSADRQSAVSGMSVSVRVDLGGRRICKIHKT